MINDYTNYVSGNDFISGNANVKTSERDFDYNSFYRATVVSISDPEKLGRIKVYIPALSKKQSFYPWAYPACFVGMGYQTGQFILPPVGSTVFVTFEYSDEHRPIYFGGIPSKYSKGKTQSYGNFINGGNDIVVGGDDLPKEYTGSQQIVYKSPTGDIIYFDSNDDLDMIKIQHNLGMSLSLVSNRRDENPIDYAELRFNGDNYFRLTQDSFEWICAGEPVDIGGGGTGDGKARTVIWD